MRIETKYFGEVEIEEEKIITFEQGILGFNDLKKYTILYDIESGDDSLISWLQSMEEPGLALPVLNPNSIKQDYNPVIEDELLTPLGEIREESLVVFVTVTIPSDITKMSVNLKAPIIINAATRKGMQIIAENQGYEIKYPIYDIFNHVSKGVE